MVVSSTPVRCDVGSEGLTFRKSVSHAFLRDSGEVVDTSGLPCVSFCFISSSLGFSFSCIDSQIGHYVILFSATLIRAHNILTMAS